MKISWNGTALTIDMQGDILISPTGGLTPGTCEAIHVVLPSPPFDVKIQAGTVVETTPENVTQIEQRILSLLKRPPSQASQHGGGLPS